MQQIKRAKILRAVIRFRLSNLMVLSSLTIVSCGKDDPTAQAEQPLNKQIVGTWKNDCTELQSNRFEQYRLEFKSSKNFEFFQTIYSDKDCTDEAFASFSSTGTYEVFEPSSNSGQAKITYTFSAFDVRPSNDSSASNFNDDSFCNLSDWSTAKQKSVLGQTCQYFDNKERTFPSEGGQVSDVFDIVSSKLYLGGWLEFGGTATTLDQSRYLKSE